MIEHDTRVLNDNDYDEIKRKFDVRGRELTDFEKSMHDKMLHTEPPSSENAPRFQPDECSYAAAYMYVPALNFRETPPAAQRWVDFCTKQYEWKWLDWIKLLHTEPEEEGTSSKKKKRAMIEHDTRIQDNRDDEIHNKTDIVSNDTDITNTNIDNTENVNVTCNNSITNLFNVTRVTDTKVVNAVKRMGAKVASMF